MAGTSGLVEKLVRDGVPALLRSEERLLALRPAIGEELDGLLEDKLVEEALEFRAGPCVEELADVLEVVSAILVRRGWTFEGLRAAARRKRGQRGGFDGGWVARFSTTVGSSSVAFPKGPRRTSSTDPRTRGRGPG